jgi:hypothetical protein
MKKKQPAPIGADPIRDFLKTLPATACFLGAKCYRTDGKAVIYVCYSFDGKTINASLSWEGGPL